MVIATWLPLMAWGPFVALLVGALLVVVGAVVVPAAGWIVLGRR